MFEVLDGSTVYIAARKEDFLRMVRLPKTGTPRV